MDNKACRLPYFIIVSSETMLWDRFSLVKCQFCVQCRCMPLWHLKKDVQKTHDLQEVKKGSENIVWNKWAHHKRCNRNTRASGGKKKEDNDDDNSNGQKHNMMYTMRRSISTHRRAEYSREKNIYAKRDTKQQYNEQIEEEKALKKN